MPLILPKIDEGTHPRHNCQMLIGFSLLVFFTSFLSAVTGMGGGAILLSLMPFFFSYKEIVPVHGLIQTVSNSVRTGSLLKHVNKKIFFFFCMGAFLGPFLSVKIMPHLTPKYFYSLLSVTIFYTVFKPKKLPELKVSDAAFIPIGLVVGTLGPIIGSIGPLLALFCLRSDWSKEEIVANKSSFQLVTHILKIPTFLYLDFSYQKFLWPIFLYSIAAIVGNVYGVKALHKTDDQMFKKLFKIFLFIAGIKIVTKALGY